LRTLATFAVPAPPPAAAGGRAEQCSSTFFDNDARSGPRRLPVRGPVGAELVGYHRLGGMSAPQFLTTFYDASVNSGHGGWRYPPNDGFPAPPRRGSVSPAAVYSTNSPPACYPEPRPR
jgi:hypothetical protein